MSNENVSNGAIKATLCTLVDNVDPKVLKTTPLPRVAEKLSWRTKIWLGLKKFPYGFIVGAGTALGTKASPLGILLFGVGGGLVMAARKVWSETAKDSSLDKNVRNVLNGLAGMEEHNKLEIFEKIMSAVLMLSELLHIDAREALRQVSINLRLTSQVPSELEELLMVVSGSLATDGPGGEGLTAQEMIAITKEAKDLKDVASRVVEAWRAKRP